MSKRKKSQESYDNIVIACYLLGKIMGVHSQIEKSINPLKRYVGRKLIDDYEKELKELIL